MMIPSRTVTDFDEEFDVVVVGYGFAGGISAINAADAGAKVLLIEKAAVPGGLSICSYGSVCCFRSTEAAFAYLKATNAGRTPDDVLHTLAEGLSGLEQYVRELAKVNGATISTTEGSAKGGNYPLPGTEEFYHTNIDSIPNYDPKQHYPWANGAAGGPRTFKIVADNLRQRNIECRLQTEALRLITNGASNEVIGLTVRGTSGVRRIKARRGVILCSGGFEGSEELKAQFWEGQPVLSAAAASNTGDGIRMAQDVGAKLWHMWHFHGAYGFKHSDASYPYGIRVKRLPDWRIRHEKDAQVKMAWILLDQKGRRFMNEYQPYTQDTAHRPMHYFDPLTQSYPRNPGILVCDENGRKMYPLGKPTSNDKGVRYDWSEDNLKEVELGILKRANSIAELADLLGVDRDAMTKSVEQWNVQCDKRLDDDFGRPSGTMVPIAAPPFYGAPIWCICSNTQGGPVHNKRQQIIDAYDQPIPRLFAAGELGSSFGHLYLSGGNIGECFVTGRIAGRNAASAAPWDSERASGKAKTAARLGHS